MIDLAASSTKWDTGKLLVPIKFAGDVDEQIAEVLIDAEVSKLVGVRQRGFGDLPSKAHVVKLWSMGVETRYNIAQAFAIGQLGKCHAEKLIHA